MSALKRGRKLDIDKLKENIDSEKKQPVGLSSAPRLILKLLEMKEEEGPKELSLSEYINQKLYEWVALREAGVDSKKVGELLKGKQMEAQLGKNLGEKEAELTALKEKQAELENELAKEKKEKTLLQEELSNTKDELLFLERDSFRFSNFTLKSILEELIKFKMEISEFSTPDLVIADMLRHRLESLDYKRPASLRKDKPAHNKLDTLLKGK